MVSTLKERITLLQPLAFTTESPSLCNDHLEVFVTSLTGTHHCVSQSRLYVRRAVPGGSEFCLHGLSPPRTDWIGPVAYRLRLPEELSSVHDTFHVSNLKKYLADANLHVPLDEIKVDKTLCFVEEPLEIMDHEVKTLKRRKIPIVKVRWNSKRRPEFTLEREDHMKAKYL
ncbi:hypothetical protein Tco_0322778 [Tanacetum coccineum]